MYLCKVGKSSLMRICRYVTFIAKNMDMSMRRWSMLRISGDREYAVTVDSIRVSEEEMWCQFDVPSDRKEGGFNDT